MIQALARRLLGLPAGRCASVVEQEWVTTPDDVRLATFHYWPVGLRDAPVLLIRTPYDVAGLPSRFALRLLAESGFHVVGQDVRGRYRSEGQFEPFANEISDGASTLAWLREQSWCSGPVGVFGASYTAYTAWAALGGSPDDVGAITSAIGSRDLYPVFHPGGAFSLEIALEWATGVGDDVGIPARRIDLERGLVHRPVREADRVALRQIDAYRDWIDHPRRDAFWDAILPALPEAPPPSLTIAGWYDFFLAAQTAEYDELARRCAEHGLPAPELLIGPWTHGGMAARRWRRGNRMPRVALRRMIEFFDRTLGKASSEHEPARPVRYFCGEADWRTAAQWPPTGSVTATFHLSHLSGGGNAASSTGDGALAEQPASDAGSDVFDSDPASPVPSLGGAGFGRRAGVADQARASTRSDVLCYATKPLDRSVEVAGNAKLVLYVSADVCDADFTAKLVDVSPAGAEVNVCEGIQRARWRDAQDRDVEPRWIEPDHITELAVDLGPTAWCFRPGHRIRIDVAGSNFPRFDRSPGSQEGPAMATETSAGRAVQTLHHGGAQPSRLLLDTLPTPESA